jgi:uncharacterized membrane protein YbhN (UPF0104 family)
VVALGLLAYVSYVASARQSGAQLWAIVQNTWALILALTFPYLLCRALVWHDLLSLLCVRVSWRNLATAFAGGEMTKSLPAGIYVENLMLGRLSHLGPRWTVRSTTATTAMLGLECALAVPAILILGIPGQPWLRLTLLAVVAAWIVILVVVRLLVGEGARRLRARPVRWLCKLAESVEEFLDAGAELLTPRTLLDLIPTAIYMLIYVVDLYAIARTVGVHHFSFLDATATYSVVVLAVVLIPIPTEIGISEFTGLGALLAYGVPHASAAIIVLSLRLLATGATILVSGAVFLLLRRHIAQERAASRGVGEEAASS